MTDLRILRKNVIEVPHGWTNVMNHPRPQQYLDNFYEWSGCMQEEQAAKNADQHIVSEPRILRKAEEYLITTSGNYRSFFTFITTDTVYDIDLVSAQDLGLKFYQPFSYAVVHFRDIPADCTARVVGHDDTI